MTQPTAPLPRSRSDNRALRRWERWTGHAGYIAEGVLYLLIGFFAMVAAVGRQQPNGAKGALAKLGGALPGDALLAVLAGGLAAFVLWQLIVAIADPEHRAERRNPRRQLVRLGHLLNGVFHCVFVGEAMWSILGLSQANNERASQVKWTAWVFELPVGRYLAALVGTGIVIFGLWQFYRAMTGDRNKRVELSRARFRLAISALGIYGLFARGTLFLLVGGYLVNAAWRHDPRFSGGIAGALAGVKQQLYGEWLLGAVASGLLCYGLYQIAKEPYRNLGNS
ncbi:MAG TPA: DUF1206 domain-containing protein [Steroidobacteraceae bacterium]|jgi:hypothetical protein